MTSNFFKNFLWNFNTLALFLLGSVGFSSVAAPILFPKEDPLKQEKVDALFFIEMTMGPNNPVSYIKQSKKIIFWANSWEDPLFKVDLGTGALPPAFIPISEANESRVHQDVELQCQCKVNKEDLLGVLIADPRVAALMYFRAGWNNKTGEEVDGAVAPVVIIYHEFAHAYDSLINPEGFLDMAVNPDRRWKNEAEKSAVEKQNDFVNTMNFLKKPVGKLRLSYGKNQLYRVSHFLEF
ncbi:hypothetical protein GW916_11930 [bacterium]|nr:hypothetical protein [bacterium]